MNKVNLISYVEKDNYTDYVCDKFDLAIQDKVVTEVPIFSLEDLNSIDNWNIGLVCGNSGSGKSTVLRHLGRIPQPQYDYSKSVVSQFPNLKEEDVVDLLTSVGLASVPTWLHKPNELSNGELARLDICKIISEVKDDVILIDEFTSVVNRDCAKSLSFALQRYIRKNNKKIILSSCHFDIIEWLKPDWIFNLNKQMNGNSDIERLVYLDDAKYNEYKLLNNKEILTDKFILP